MTAHRSSPWDEYVVNCDTSAPAGERFIHSKSHLVRAPYSKFSIRKAVRPAGQQSYLPDGRSAAGGDVSYRIEWDGTHAIRDTSQTDTYTYTAVDTLPACAVNEEPAITAPSFGAWSYEFIPAEGDPCHGEGTPAQIKWHGVSTNTVTKTAWYTVTFRDGILPNTKHPAPVAGTFDVSGVERLYKEATASATVTISAGPAFLLSSKSVGEPLVRTGEDVAWTLTLINTGSGDSGVSEWIDILPHNGDTRLKSGEARGSEIGSAIGSSETALSDLSIDEYSWRATAPIPNYVPDADLQFAVTTANPATLVVDPAAPSNEAEGLWCWIEADGDCAAELANATALWVRADTMPAYGAVDIDISASTANMADESHLVNYLGCGRGEGLILEVPESPNVVVDVYDLLIDGDVWYDTDANAAFDEGEPLLEGAVVELINEAGEVVSQTETDAEGYYFFGQGFTPDRTQPWAQATDREPLFLVDGTYTTRVKHDGVVLAEWDFTYSGANEELNGTSTDLELGRESRDVYEGFPKYQKADFGLVGEYFIQWQKIDDVFEPLGGASFTVTGPEGECEITDDDATDLDDRHGFIKVQVPAVGTYEVSELVAPIGYIPTDETLSGDLVVTAAPEGEVVLELGALVNETFMPRRIQTRANLVLAS